MSQRSVLHARSSCLFSLCSPPSFPPFLPFLFHLASLFPKMSSFGVSLIESKSSLLSSPSILHWHFTALHKKRWWKWEQIKISPCIACLIKSNAAVCFCQLDCVNILPKRTIQISTMPVRSQGMCMPFFSEIMSEFQFQIFLFNFSPVMMQVQDSFNCPLLFI